MCFLTVNNVAMTFIFIKCWSSFKSSGYQLNFILLRTRSTYMPLRNVLITQVGSFLYCWDSLFPSVCFFLFVDVMNISLRSVKNEMPRKNFIPTYILLYCSSLHLAKQWCHIRPFFVTLPWFSTRSCQAASCHCHFQFWSFSGPCLACLDQQRDIG